ncbi:DUF805 domain-containing protein [Vibrio artabrorum]|uniref:DUF805 domain-containing protein n=1 Tax=Vibrio artabrorum TaxID=446374 RepID=UPI00354F47FE
MEYFIGAIRKYSVFKGRARRKEFWYFYLVSFVISLVLAFLDHQLGTYDPELGGGLLGGIYGIFIFLPSLALTVRRIHDTGRSGYWAFLLLVPLVGLLVILFFALTDSNSGSNEYGGSPKESAS